MLCSPCHLSFWNTPPILPITSRYLWGLWFFFGFVSFPWKTPPLNLLYILCGGLSGQRSYKAVPCCSLMDRQWVSVETPPWVNHLASSHMMSYSLQVSNALYLVSLYALKKCDKDILEDCYVLGLFENETTDNILALWRQGGRWWLA